MSIHKPTLKSQGWENVKVTGLALSLHLCVVNGCVMLPEIH